MTNLADYLLTRRSIPSASLGTPGPDAETLSTMLTIAMRVPDHGKLAPWRFIRYDASDGEAIGLRLEQIWRQRDPEADERRLEQERMRFLKAPVVIGVVSKAADHPKIPVWEQQLSAGAVCLNLLHAASAHGFASQWLTEWYSFDDEAAAYLGCRESEVFAGFVHIGTPKDPPVERARPDLDDHLVAWKPEA